MPIFHDPNTAILALFVGLLGIIFEFHAPGTVLPGVVGAALVLLSASALSHYALNPGAIVLVALATFLLIVELKVALHGILAVPGAVLLACGVYLLIDSPDPAQHVRGSIAFGIAFPVALLTAFLLIIARRATKNKAANGPNSLIGRIGSVVAGADLRIQVAGEYWNAKASERLPAGTAVRVDGVHGLELAVTPLHDTIGVK